MCLQQTGADFFGNSYPLFTKALGGGYSTGPFLYGELLWTSFFGNSVYAFRSFLACITTLTLFFLFDGLRKCVSLRVAMIALLIGSLSPWVFQFARIAWDPPLAPFFLVFGLWCLDLKNRFNWILGGLAIALASYSYPPCRIQALIILLALPGRSWKNKAKVIGVFSLASVPIFYRAWVDPWFTARGKMLLLNSDYTMNPFRDDGFFMLTFDFIKQFFEHLTPEFLVLKGDHNLRHSTEVVGELSYPEALLIYASPFIWFWMWLRHKKVVFNPMVVFAVMGIASGIIPGALTWESVPHALRIIGAWPFFAMLGALTLDCVYREAREAYGKRAIYGVKGILLTLGLWFALVYFPYYFEEYPTASLAWFQDEPSPLGSAYRKMTEQGEFCADLRVKSR
jgi:hypothetical protein